MIVSSGPAHVTFTYLWLICCNLPQDGISQCELVTTTATTCCYLKCMCCFESTGVGGCALWCGGLDKWLSLALKELRTIDNNLGLVSHLWRWSVTPCSGRCVWLCQPLRRGAWQGTAFVVPSPALFPNFHLGWLCKALIEVGGDVEIAAHIPPVYTPEGLGS